MGNARTALFNWLVARQSSDGVNVLRIEDTDVARSEARYEDQLVEDLKWMGIDFDEGPNEGGDYGPYRQSDRLEIYRDYAEQLLSEGKAYLCFCSDELLEADRQSAMAEQRQPVYVGRCRSIAPEEASRRRASGVPCAVRLRVPEHPIRFHDLVRGAIEFPSEVVGDIVIVRSAKPGPGPEGESFVAELMASEVASGALAQNVLGMPIYNFVVVIDDVLMKITHVIRGDDHVSNTPKQVAVYEALGMPVPEFAHLSTILGADRERLSKRHGATSIVSFREMGVLPEALVNYLALLGWAPTGGTKEIFSPAELIAEFDLSRVTPSPAVFDMEKLYWLNRHYLKQAAPERIVALALPDFVKAGYLPNAIGEASDEVRQWFARVVALLVPYVDRLEQLPEKAKIFFAYDAAGAVANPDNAEVLGAASCAAVLQAFYGKVRSEQAGKFTAERFKEIINEVKAEAAVKGKDLFHPIRTVMTGSHSGPDFDKLIPLLEDGAALPLPVHVKSVRERVEEFAGVKI